MKTLHIVMGPPGVGKTTYGTKLAVELRAAFVDIDTATEAVVRAGLELAKQSIDDRDSPLFKATFREPIYETLFAIALNNLSHLDVVITGPFTKESRDSNWLETLESNVWGNIKVHFLTCETETRRQRLKSRGNPRDHAKLADWDNSIPYYEEDKRPAFPHHLVNTNDTVSE